MIVFKSLPNDTFFDQSKFKAFADYKIKVIEKLKFVLARVENSVRKGVIAGYQHSLHFLLFSLCFQGASFSVSLKKGIVW